MTHMVNLVYSYWHGVTTAASKFLSFYRAETLVDNSFMWNGIKWNFKIKNVRLLQIWSHIMVVTSCHSHIVMS